MDSDRRLGASEIGLRDDLAWLADRGLISLGLGTWPMPAALATAALAAKRSGDWSGADLDALARVRAALERMEEWPCPAPCCPWASSIAGGARPVMPAPCWAAPRRRSRP